MARRKKNDGLVDILLASPWWVSVVVGCLAFSVLRWIMPAFLAKNSVFFAVGAAMRSVAWLPLLGCAVIAAIVYLRTQARAGSGSQISAVIQREMAMRAPPSPVTAPAHIKMEEAWGRSAGHAAPSSEPPQAFAAWSLDALRALEWKRFELLCAKYYETVGFKSETLRCGADGGIDVKLFKNDPGKPIAIVQCKAWNAQPVGVKEIRELLGVMAHEKVERGIFLTTGTYTKEALAFGAANPIQLLDGDAFLSKIRGLPAAQQEALLTFAFDGDYRTPTCASCGIKMTKRESRRGPFWGCLNYPRCRSKFPIKA